MIRETFHKLKGLFTRRPKPPAKAEAVVLPTRRRRGVGRRYPTDRFKARDAEKKRKAARKRARRARRINRLRKESGA